MAAVSAPRARPARKAVALGGTVAVSVALALGLALLAGCRREGPMPEPTQGNWLDSREVLSVAFHPRREGAGTSSAPHAALDIPVADGATLGARFYAAAPTDPTVLFFHGNGEIVADYDQLAPLFGAMGAGFLPVDYRGYGRSTGRPTMSAMLADARTVFVWTHAWLLAQQRRQAVIVMGRSLGSAPALEIAAAYPAGTAGLIIDSGFADAAALMARLGARLPAAPPPDALLRQEEKIAAYAGPTLIIHGTDDRIIPVADAEALFRASGSGTRRLLRIPGAGHNDLLAVGMAAYVEAVGEHIRQVGSHD